jgi:hypothetical protein
MVPTASPTLLSPAFPMGPKKFLSRGHPGGVISKRAGWVLTPSLRTLSPVLTSESGIL